MMSSVQLRPPKVHVKASTMAMLRMSKATKMQESLVTFCHKKDACGSCAMTPAQIGAGEVNLPGTVHSWCHLRHEICAHRQHQLMCIWPMHHNPGDNLQHSAFEATFNTFSTSCNKQISSRYKPAFNVPRHLWVCSTAVSKLKQMFRE